MDKMTAGQALAILHSNPSAIDRCKIAALIERQEADAAAMREAIKQVKYAYLWLSDGAEIGGTLALSRSIGDAVKIALSTTAGAVLLDVVKAAEKANALLKIYAETGAIPNGGEQEGNWACICAVYDALDAALVAYRGGERG